MKFYKSRTFKIFVGVLVVLIIGVIKELNEYIDEYKYAMGVVRTYCDINDSLKYSEEEEWEGIEAGVEA